MSKKKFQKPNSPNDPLEKCPKCKRWTDLENIILHKMCEECHETLISEQDNESGSQRY